MLHKNFVKYKSISENRQVLFDPRNSVEVALCSSEPELKLLDKHVDRIWVTTFDLNLLSIYFFCGKGGI
jgi:hypothetical protein